MFFDPVYLVFLAPGILLALWAQIKVKSAYAVASRIPSRTGYLFRAGLLGGRR